MLDKTERLKIVFVTDIHLNKEALNQLEKWSIEFSNTEPQFDYCFIGGDTANWNHQVPTNQEQMLEGILETHQRLKQIFSCPLFFVPGNHDVPLFFKESFKEYGFTNIHNKVIQLSDGLNLMGFGGSTPGISEGSEIWSGYPYSSDQELEKECKKGQFFHETSIQGKNQFIVLTHEGPSESPTTVDRKNRKVETGSVYLSKFLNRKDLVLWLHGHTHDGSKYAMINEIPIICPGALLHNEFLYFEVIKTNNRWVMGKANFQKLF